MIEQIIFNGIFGIKCKGIMTKKYAACLFSLLRASLILLSANIVICIEDSDEYTGTYVSRQKRQNPPDESSPHGHASWIRVSHPYCARGRYTGQVIFLGEDQNAVPDGNGTFTCVQETPTDNGSSMSRRGTNIRQENSIIETYTGAWKEGERSGLGVTTYKNGDVYSGSYVDDKRNGQGDMVWAFDSGSPEAQYQRRYVGHYVDNIRNGKGKMTYPNGDKYTGDWVDGNRSGKGLYLYSETGNRYKGDYVNNKKEGNGIFWWTTGSHAGDRYEGEFKEDKRHGYGIYRYSNGDIYDGSWSNGNQQGEGLLLYASGNRLEGTWNSGKRDGQMILTVPTGERFCANFVQDEREGEWVEMVA